MLALVLLGPGQSLRERIDLTLHDLLAEQVVAPWQRHRLPDRSGDIAIVAIDDASLQALGRWPWPRARHAELIEALTRAGVQGIGYDILFSEPSDDPAGDRRLARAITTQGQVVLPVMPVIADTPGPAAVLRPLPALAAAAAALGHVDTPIDADGQVRRIARRAGSGAAGWPAMPLALQQVTAPRAAGTPAPAPRTEPGPPVWWRERLQFLPGDARPVLQVAAVDVLRDPAVALMLAGRAVWVGVTARGIDTTLRSPRSPDGEPLGAVQWLALTHQALEQGGLVDEVASLPRGLLNTLPLLATGVLVARTGRSPGRRGAALLLFGPLLLAGAGLLLAQLWLPVGTLLTAVIAGFLASRAVDLHAARVTLKRERRLASMTLQAITDAVLTLDADGRLTTLNPAAQRLTGLPLERALGLGTATLLHSPPLDRQRLDQALADCRAQRVPVTLDLPLQVTTADGDRLVRAVVSPIRRRDGVATVVVLTDVTEAVRAARQIAHNATHDALTGLPNRVLLSDRLTHALLQGRRPHHRLAVLCIDLDRFGRINDSLGAQQGDHLLRTMAARLQTTCRPHDTLARWSSDQFIALIEDVGSREVVAAMAARMIEVVGERLAVDDGSDIVLSCSASVGIALAPDDARDSDTLLAMAGTALARAKAAGGGRFEFHASSIAARTRDWLALETRLRQALATDAFVLHYQVQVDARTGRPVGLEALLRWRQEDGELWAPARFLAVTEETGLIVAVGNWVIETAIRQLRRWRDLGLPLVPVSVNVSARQCLDLRLVDVVTSALARADITPSLLKVEITESAAMAELDHLRDLLERLRQAGVAVALDDFGTGFSSLVHLRHFPVDQIKIDPGFIGDVPRSASASAIVSATIALAHGLGVPVVAEGVESVRQLEFLRAHGCDIIQGYLYGRPAPPEDIEDLLTSADALPHCLPRE